MIFEKRIKKKLYKSFKINRNCVYNWELGMSTGSTHIICEPGFKSTAQFNTERKN